MLLINQEFWYGFSEALAVCSVIFGIAYLLKFRKQKQQ